MGTHDAELAFLKLRRSDLFVCLSQLNTIVSDYAYEHNSLKITKLRFVHCR